MKREGFRLDSTNGPVGMGKTISEILSFRLKPDGWYYGKGKSASTSAIRVALELAKILNDTNPDCIETFPKIDGGIVVSGIKDGRVVDFCVSPSGQVDIVLDEDDEDVLIRESADVNFAKSYLEIIGWKVTQLSGYFTRSITATHLVVSRAQQSQLREMDYRLLMRPARSAVPVPSASTAAATTNQGFRVNLPYSQESSSQNSRERRLNVTTPKVTAAIS